MIGERVSALGDGGEDIEVRRTMPACGCLKSRS
jgi:hypothetical protein